MSNILITGGAGFIGSNFVNYLVNKQSQNRIIVLDALTYAGNLSSLMGLIEEKKIQFIHGNICDAKLLMNIFTNEKIDTVVHFAAESHVDRSIVEPDAFVKTNVNGTQALLNVALNSWKDDFLGKRFHHISTDEVYGDLGPDDPAFTEKTPYAPRSPYAASKAASDLLVRAYYTTYGLPITISNCSNNYGPFHFPEKLIPLMIINALHGRDLPIYGKGQNIRDWLFVLDHCRAIELILLKGKIGETYNIGGENEIININLVRQLCEMIDQIFQNDASLKLRFPQCPASKGQKCDSLITFVKDRPGHDRRYAINQAKIFTELGFAPSVNFDTGLFNTIQWYLENETWWQTIVSGDYQNWIYSHYGEQPKR